MVGGSVVVAAAAARGAESALLVGNKVIVEAALPKLMRKFSADTDWKAVRIAQRFVVVRREAEGVSVADP